MPSGREVKLLMDKMGEHFEDYEGMKADLPCGVVN